MRNWIPDGFSLSIAKIEDVSIPSGFANLRLLHGNISLPIPSLQGHLILWQKVYIVGRSIGTCHASRNKSSPRNQGTEKEYKTNETPRVCTRAGMR